MTQLEYQQFQGREGAEITIVEQVTTIQAFDQAGKPVGTREESKQINVTARIASVAPAQNANPMPPGVLRQMNAGRENPITPRAQPFKVNLTLPAGKELPQGNYRVCLSGVCNNEALLLTPHGMDENGNHTMSASFN